MSDKTVTSRATIPPSERPIERRKTYELVTDRLVAMIGEGTLRPGDQLPTERELTDSFRVGRSSVREALRMLESQGVIRDASGGSFVVAETMNPLNSSFRLLLELDDRAGLHDLFELRRILECEAAALAAERRATDHLQEMDAAIAAMCDGLGDARGDRFIDADLHFHLALAEATDNRLIVHSMHAVRDTLRRALMTVYTIPGSPQSAIGEHRAIRAAVAARQATRARKAMALHLARVEGDVEEGSGDG